MTAYRARTRTRSPNREQDREMDRGMGRGKGREQDREPGREMGREIRERDREIREQGREIRAPRGREIRATIDDGEEAVAKGQALIMQGQEQIMRGRQMEKDRIEHHAEDKHMRQMQVRAAQGGVPYKKTLCKYHARRAWSCMDGDRCTFAHGEEERRRDAFVGKGGDRRGRSMDEGRPDEGRREEGRSG